MKYPVGPLWARALLQIVYINKHDRFFRVPLDTNGMTGGLSNDLVGSNIKESPVYVERPVGKSEIPKIQRETFYSPP